MEDMHLNEFKEWLTEQERAENTIKSYCTSVSIYFIRYDRVNKKNMIDFKRSQSEKWKPKTANNRIAAMNAYCEFIQKPECRIKQLKLQKGMGSLENVITLDEYNKLLDGLQKDGNMRGYWIIKFLAQTGARASEFVRLPLSALEKGYAEIWTKGKYRRIYIPDSLISESRDYFASQKSNKGLLFPNRRGQQMTTGGLETNTRRWCEKYGVRKEAAHPHSFRHLYAINFLKHNSNIALLSDLMGHSDVGTTAIYTRLSTAEQMSEFNRASVW
jgi:site-specific recombinase XerD